GGGLSEPEGQVGGDDFTVRQPPDSVSTEETRHARNPCACLTLRELRRLAGLLETGLLALDDAGVAREEPGLLERRAVVLAVDLVEGAGDREAQGARLTRGAAARDLGLDVVGAEQVEHLERVVDELLVQLVGEVVLECAAVHEELPAAGDEAHLRDGLLAPADG